MQALILRSQSDPMEMLRILFSKPQSCNHVNVCTVLHRCARMGDALPDEARERVRAELLPVVRDVLPDCRGRHLCNVAWSLAKMRLAEEEEMVDMIVAELTEPGVLESCNGGELAMAVWAVVALGYASEYAGFLMAAAEPITAKAGELKPKEIGLITWAYAAALTHVWGDEVDDPTTEMRWLAAPVQALMERTLRCEDQLKPKDIAMVAWAFGRLVKVDWNGLGPHVDMLCATLASSALKCIKQFSAQDLAELAVGVVHMQYDNANLMQLIAFQATQKLRQFSHRELSNLIWAFGKVFRRPRRFVLAVVEEARGRLPHFTKQELANLAWALTVLEVYDKALLSEVFVVMQRKREALDESDLNQLYQVYSLLKLQAPDAVTGVGPRLLKQMETAWARSKEREKRLTDRQAAVSRILQTLNIECVPCRRCVRCAGRVKWWLTVSCVWLLQSRAGGRARHRHPPSGAGDRYGGGWPGALPAQHGPSDGPHGDEAEDPPAAGVLGRVDPALRVGPHPALVVHGAQALHPAQVHHRRGAAFQQERLQQPQDLPAARQEEPLRLMGESPSP